jgi:hypothetical protein
LSKYRNYQLSSHTPASDIFNRRTKSEDDSIPSVPLRTCIVSYTDSDCKRSVEVIAETLNEAAVLGLKAMNVPSGNLYLLSIDVLVKSPQVYHSISGASLNAWLAQPGKSPKEQALKSRLKELLRGPTGAEPTHKTSG